MTAVTARRGDIAKAMMAHGSPKESKAEVGYTRGTKAEHCGACTHYAAHECSLVEGKIFPAMWCRRYEARAAR